MALSLAIPFFKLSMFSVTEEQAAGAKQLLIYLTQLPASPVQEEYINWEIIVIAVISSLFVCYLVYSVLRIFRLKAMNSKTEMGEFTFIETDLDEAPFSLKILSQDKIDFVCASLIKSLLSRSNDKINFHWRWMW